MKPELSQIKSALKLALAEDIGNGDVTSESTIPEHSRLSGYWIAKQAGVIAGLEVVLSSSSIRRKTTKTN